MDFLDYDDEGRPLVARAAQAGSYYFITWKHETDETLELWADAGGTPLAGFIARYAEMAAFPPARLIRSLESSMESGTASVTETRLFHYDSLGNISAISGTNGDYPALYTEKGPVSWTAQTAESGASKAARALQWDENGLLTSIDAVTFDYETDRRGNWVERREHPEMTAVGLRIAKPGPTLTRNVRYR
jgi:hypothetical protein